jgi:predicted SprT family Zn-dependent metalloprotease
MEINIHKQLNSAFDHFNKTLFENKLPRCIITIASKGKVYGHYVKERFICRKGDGLKLKNQFVDEIALNPDCFDRDDILVLSTLVHEMAHLWQYEHGKPSRTGYHNKEWGTKMEELGLMPSSTGKQEGKRTGQKMSHYIIYGGLFEKRANEYLDRFKVDYRGQRMISGEKKKKTVSKLKYTCSECGLNAWAKPGSNLMCGDCELHLDPEE